MGSPEMGNEATCWSRGDMLVLGIETSCDETGVGSVELPAPGQGYAAGLLAQALHSQVDMHAEYGGVVPELASRDHIRRLLPLARQVLSAAGRGLSEIDGIAYTEGPGLAGALLVGASMASGLAYALGVPTVGIHHLEGHLLSPLLAPDPPAFPFVALLVSGGHTQLMHVRGVGRYDLLGETQDDAAGEAFDKTAQLLGLGYPGGPGLSRLAEQGTPRPVQAATTHARQRRSRTSASAGSRPLCSTAARQHVAGRARRVPIWRPSFRTRSSRC